MKLFMAKNKKINAKIVRYVFISFLTSRVRQ